MTTYFTSNGVTLFHGNALDVLREMPAASVHCVVTSPPYWGLRRYSGVDPAVWNDDPTHAHEWGDPVRSSKANEIPGPSDNVPKNGAFRSVGKEAGSFCACGAWRGCLGLEPTPDLFVSHLVAIFHEVRRVMRDDATCWLNIGDSFAGSGRGPTGKNGIGNAMERQGFVDAHMQDGLHPSRRATAQAWNLKAKDLCLIPERLAIALQDDGWWIRQRIAWIKRSCMPESVTDRATCCWEYVWMLAKSDSYFYDSLGFQEESVSESPAGNGFKRDYRLSVGGRGSNDKWQVQETRNMRNAWVLGPEPFGEAHYATFPSAIPRRCILVSTSEHGCCPACGAPWERVNERVNERAGQERVTATGGAITGGTACSTLGGGQADHVTVAWRPTCRCIRDVGESARVVVPATVLDPFSGSGTTGLVARQGGRRYVGIDASREYLDLSIRTRFREAMIF